MAWGVFCAKRTEDCCRAAASGGGIADPDARGRRLATEEEEGTALYHACQAQYFHSQLPLTENADASSSKINERGYATAQENDISKEFAQIGEHGLFAESGEEKIKRVSSQTKKERVFLDPAVENRAVEWRRGDFLDEYRNKRVNVSTSVKKTKKGRTYAKCERK